MSINERLFFLLDTKEISQAELSSATGIPSQTISGWKNRKTDPPAYLIPVIADFLKVSCDFLLKGDSCENIPEFLKRDATSVSENESGNLGNQLICLKMLLDIL